MTDSNLGDSMTGDQRAEVAEPTPGPWRIYIGNHRLDITGPLTEAGAWLVAQTVSDNETDQANARLIAAAPEMLAALKRVNRPCPERADIDAANAAIAKAEGRS